MQAPVQKMEDSCSQGWRILKNNYAFKSVVKFCEMLVSKVIKYGSYYFCDKHSGSVCFWVVGITVFSEEPATFSTRLI